jgi:hypothetical protein
MGLVVVVPAQTDGGGGLHPIGLFGEFNMSVAEHHIAAAVMAVVVGREGAFPNGALELVMIELETAKCESRPYYERHHLLAR